MGEETCIDVRILSLSCKAGSAKEGILKHTAGVKADGAVFNAQDLVQQAFVCQLCAHWRHGIRVPIDQNQLVDARSACNVIKV